MSYSLGLHPDRPAPAGIAAFSGFIPTVEGWHPDLATRTGTKAFIAHGRNDPVISVDFGRAARTTLTDAGLAVEYHEGDGAHFIDSAHARAAISWLPTVL
jgi:phospholipase/carboxylesterase